MIRFTERDFKIKDFLKDDCAINEATEIAKNLIDISLENMKID